MNGFKTTVLVVLTVLVLLFGGLVIKIVFFPANTVSKSVDTAYEVVKETMTGKKAATQKKKK